MQPSPLPSSRTFHHPKQNPMAISSHAHPDNHHSVCLDGCHVSDLSECELNLSGCLWPVAPELDGTGSKLGCTLVSPGPHSRPKRAALLEEGPHCDGNPSMKARDPGTHSDRAAAENGHSFLLIRKSAASADGVTRTPGLSDGRRYHSHMDPGLEPQCQTHKTETVRVQEHLIDPQPATCRRG